MPERQNQQAGGGQAGHCPAAPFPCRQADRHPQVPHRPIHHHLDKSTRPRPHLQRMAAGIGGLPSRNLELRQAEAGGRFRHQETAGNTPGANRQRRAGKGLGPLLRLLPCHRLSHPACSAQIGRCSGEVPRGEVRARSSRWSDGWNRGQPGLPKAVIAQPNSGWNYGWIFNPSAEGVTSVAAPPLRVATWPGVVTAVFALGYGGEGDHLRRPGTRLPQHHGGGAIPGRPAVDDAGCHRRIPRARLQGDQGPAPCTSLTGT